jgi:hypothetical protein
LGERPFGARVVLRLDGEEVLDDVGRPGQRRSDEMLRPQAPDGDRRA